MVQSLHLSFSFPGLATQAISQNVPINHKESGKIHPSITSNLSNSHQSQATADCLCTDTSVDCVEPKNPAEKLATLTNDFIPKVSREAAKER